MSIAQLKEISKHSDEHLYASLTWHLTASGKPVCAWTTAPAGSQSSAR
jgi:hypothetical protein